MKSKNKLYLYWGYRGFILSSIGRELQLRYRKSLLGITWIILKPAGMIFVYTLIFSKIMGSRFGGEEHIYIYSIYLCSGIIIWNLFSDITLQIQSCFLDNSNLIKKLNFPRLCLPIIAISNAIINFLIIYILFLIFLILFNSFPGLVIISTLPLLILLVVMGMGIGLIIAVVNVFFRDAGQVFGVWIQIWFWLTPIVYIANVLPDYVKSIVDWNPITPIVNGFHNIFTKGIWPIWGELLYPLVVAAGFLAFGLYLFKKHNAEMVDEI